MAYTSSSSLRERKKQKQRTAIQHHALQLFQDYGYTAVTVERIAASADVSVGTFFNYFKTKAEVVLFNGLGAQFTESFLQQSSNQDVIQALRHALRATLLTTSEGVIEYEHQRFNLIQETPELRAAMVVRLAEGIPSIATLLHIRSFAPDLETAKTLAGAIVGVGIATLLAITPTTLTNFMDRFDAALTSLERYLPGKEIKRKEPIHALTTPQ